MKHPFKPDCAFARLDDITPEFLLSIGIRYLLCDLDNTLVAPNTRYPTPSAIAWLERLRQAGIRVMLVSNNSRKRVRDFCKNLSVRGIYQARKPLPAGLTRARKRMKAKPGETAFLGDQLFTDILGARLAGLTAIYVKPKEKEHGWFFELKRRLEEPFLREYTFLYKKRRPHTQAD